MAATAGALRGSALALSLELARDGAALLGADGLVLMSRAPLPSGLPGVAAVAVRDGADTVDAAGELSAAFGDDLAGLAVAYLDCAGEAGLAEEIASLAGRCAGAMAIELEDGREPLAGLAADLRACALDPVPLRQVRTGRAGAEAARRLLVRWPGVPAPPAEAMAVCISDHQGKAAPFVAALREAGHVVVADPRFADVVLVDHDLPAHGKLGLVEACVDAGGRAFLYPHGADPANMCSWDGLYPVSPLLSGALMLAPGHADIARIAGYPYPAQVVGWPYCDLAPRRHAEPRRVLMAPMHPPYLGNERNPRVNGDVFRRLLRLPVQLTVRHIGSLAENGLWPAPGVTFIRGDIADAPSMIEQIDAADAVVAGRGTFACIAVARGATTVVWDSAVVRDNTGARAPTNLDRYLDDLRFPFDVEDGPLGAVLDAAAADAERVETWRARYVGEPLSGAAVVRALRGG